MRLVPCRFCGPDAHLTFLQPGTSGDPGGYITCDLCGCAGPTEEDRTAAGIGWAKLMAPHPSAQTLEEVTRLTRTALDDARAAALVRVAADLRGAAGAALTLANMCGQLNDPCGHAENTAVALALTRASQRVVTDAAYPPQTIEPEKGKS